MPSIFSHRRRMEHTRRADLLASSRRRWRRSAFEELEERAMLTISDVPSNLQNALQPYQAAIDGALDVAVSLPLVGQALSELGDVRTLLDNSLGSIQSALQTLPQGHVVLPIPLTTITTSFDFNLGLDAFLKLTASGQVSATISPVLTVAFDYDSDGNVTLDTAHTKLDVDFGLSLPNVQLTGSLNGYLYAHAVDQGTNFNGDLSFQFDPSNGVTAHYSGDAHILFGLSLSFVDPATNASFNPTFVTTLDMDWGINDQSNTMQVPHIALKNFGLDVHSFMHSFLGDIVTTVQKYTKPLEPFIDIFDTPVPIISAFDGSETIGDLLLKGAAMNQDQQDRFNLMIKVVKAVNALDPAGSTAGGVLSFGDINLTGDAQQTGGFDFDLSAIKGLDVMNEIFNSSEFQDLQKTLTSVASYAGVFSTAGFQFPLLEDPGPVIGAILTGGTKTMFSFSTGREHFELAPSLTFGIKDLFGISLTAGIIFDADFSMGYDTQGLVQLFKDADHNPADLLHGFYFDNGVDTTDPPIPNVSSPRNTALYLQGFAELSASVGVTFTGGIHANVSIELASNDNSQHVYLDTMIQSLSTPAKVFKASGEVYADATIEITLDTEVGPKITFFSYELARAEILNYNPPPTPSLGLPLHVIDSTTQHTLLLDPSKMTGGPVRVQPFHDFTITSAGTFVGDGIRVDYPGEIDLFIERKDDANTDYYNLIGVNGVVPPGSTISIDDPFRMFQDEGATNPAPQGTKSGVILVGGTSVSFTYTEASEGTHPTVLLAGGYGSNTLAGGTMEFGNFIPPDRIDQAKRHFADTAGFDATQIASINAAIDADVAPADPAGIISATMTASRGGLMLGGPGNNSFIASGPGDYQMIGGTWVNTFTISPSFNGVAAQYAIDGGPFGQSSLVVRAPSDEHVVFQNAAVDDKYNPAYKALEVDANAGTSAIAHGIQKVHIVAAEGSSVELGDTSQLNIDFTISGSAHLKFGGSIKPDTFVTSVGNDGAGYFAMKNHYFDSLYEDGVVIPDSSSAPDGDPVYYITRTFGTTGVTQTVPFEVQNADVSDITLDGGGASDTYDLYEGIGSFLNVTIDDSDASTQNTLSVVMNINQSYGLFPDTLQVTDNVLDLKYETLAVNEGAFYDYKLWRTSVVYEPAISFSSNVDVTLDSLAAFKHTTVDRPNATNAVTLVYGFGSPNLEVIDVTDPHHPNIFVYNDPTIPNDYPTIDVLANAGSLAIQQEAGFNAAPIFTLNVQKNTGDLTVHMQDRVGHVDTVNIYQNAGSITVYNFNTNVGVFGNAGTINFIDNDPAFITAQDSQITIGNNDPNALGSLDNVHGTIKISGEGEFGGWVGVVVDDRNGSVTPQHMTVSPTGLQVGDLAINLDTTDLSYASSLDIRYRLGTHLSLLNGLPLYQTTFNSEYGFPLQWEIPFDQTNTDGDVIDQSLANFNQYPTGPVTYSATNLPPGLLLNTATGEITGTIAHDASVNSPYSTTFTASSGGYDVTSTISWTVYGAITVSADALAFSSVVQVNDGESVSIGPFTAYDPSSLPVTFSATGLPSWLTFDPATASIVGTAPGGTSADGIYHVVVNGTDGIDRGSLAFDISVSSIRFGNLPPLRANHDGDTVSVDVSATTDSGLPLTYSGQLPSGLTIDSSGVIHGTLNLGISNAVDGYTIITATDGLTSRTVAFDWNILPTGVSDALRIASPGPQVNAVGDNVSLGVRAYSSIFALSNLTVQGLPSGITLTNSGTVNGTVTSDMVEHSPYLVTLTATDGLYSTSTAFEWTFVAANPISVTNPGTITSTVHAAIDQQITATTTDGLPLSYSASGLPGGLSINAQTGEITGTIPTLAAMPGVFDVTVTATDGTNSTATKFRWNVDSDLGFNKVALAAPGGGTITLTSPDGTLLTASLVSDPGAAPPGTLQFPFGYIEFDVTAAFPFGTFLGAAATLTISGAGLGSADHYYNYGPTPANAMPHWYDFLFNQKTDGDNATGTGMANSGGLVLHLLDGGRGDDDLSKNNDIHGFGGPAHQLSGMALPAGDSNHDGIVNSQDIAMVSSRWLQTGLNNPGDINGDGIVNSQDIALITSNWLATLMSQSGGANSLASSQDLPAVDVVPTAIEVKTGTSHAASGISDSLATPSAPIVANLTLAGQQTSAPAATTIVTPIEALPFPQAVDRRASAVGIAAIIEPATLDYLMSSQLDNGDFEWLTDVAHRGRSRRLW
jgi:hypothetical protein